MKLCYKHTDISHIVCVGHPYHSAVFGIVKKLEPGWWEWQVRHREGRYDVANSRYRPAMIRCGYANDREKALRKVVDYIKSEEWDV